MRLRVKLSGHLFHKGDRDKGHPDTSRGHHVVATTAGEAMQRGIAVEHDEVGVLAVHRDGEDGITGPVEAEIARDDAETATRSRSAAERIAGNGVRDVAVNGCDGVFAVQFLKRPVPFPLDHELIPRQLQRERCGAVLSVKRSVFRHRRRRRKREARVRLLDLEVPIVACHLGRLQLARKVLLRKDFTPNTTCAHCYSPLIIFCLRTQISDYLSIIAPIAVFVNSG